MFDAGDRDIDRKGVGVRKYISTLFSLYHKMDLPFGIRKRAGYTINPKPNLNSHRNQCLNTNLAKCCLYTLGLLIQNAKHIALFIGTDFIGMLFELCYGLLRLCGADVSRTNDCVLYDKKIQKNETT